MDKGSGTGGLHGLLGRDYWLVLSAPLPATTGAQIERHVRDHVAWLLKLEAEGALFLSGPLVSGPGTGPGSGITVLRAGSAQDAGRSLRRTRSSWPGCGHSRSSAGGSTRAQSRFSCRWAPAPTRGARPAAITRKAVAAVQVAVIGLGKMGLPIARNLLERGFAVVGYRRSPSDELARAGGAVAQTAAEAAANADVVLSIVPDADAVQEVVSGPAGTLTMLRPGTVHIEMSTIPVGRKLRIRDSVREAGGGRHPPPHSARTEQP